MPPELGRRGRNRTSVSAWLGLLDEPGNPDQDYSADEGNNDGGNHSSAQMDPKHPKHPSSHQASEKAKDDVHDDAVATTLHDLACQPACDQTGNDPREKAHTKFLLGSQRSKQMARGLDCYCFP